MTNITPPPVLASNDKQIALRLPLRAVALIELLVTNALEAGLPLDVVEDCKAVLDAIAAAGAAL